MAHFRGSRGRQSLLRSRIRWLQKIGAPQDMINESSLALKEAAKMRAQKIEGERAGRSAAKKGQVEASSSGPARNSAAGPSPTPAFSLEAGRCEVSVRLAAPRPQTATTNGAVAVAPPAEVATPVELEDPPAADPVVEAVSTYE